MAKHKEYHFEIWQGGVEVVSGGGTNLEQTKSMMVHYAAQYVQDGPIKITGSKELAPSSVITYTPEKS